ncbi:MAG: hypothetical protein V3R85_11875 [Alphaproteobacteria bacterium]
MKRLIKRVFIALVAGFILAPTGLGAASKSKDIPAPEAGTPSYNAKKDRLSQTRYYTMKPFTLPLLAERRVIEQFTLVISLEMVDEEARIDISRVVPRIRDTMYQTLFQMVTFRRRGAPLPDVDMFKQRMLKIALKVASKKLVKGIIVQQAFKQPVQ